MDGDFTFGSLLGTVQGLGSKYFDYRLAKDIDAERQQPFVVNDPAGMQWLVGPQGQLYQRGTPATFNAAGVAQNPLLMLGLLGAAAALLVFALKD